MKIPRFVREYANDSKKCIMESDLMQERFKKEKIARIEKAVSLLERGMITVNETMRLICEI